MRTLPKDGALWCTLVNTVQNLLNYVKSSFQQILKMWNKFIYCTYCIHITYSTTEYCINQWWKYFCIHNGKIFLFFSFFWLHTVQCTWISKKEEVIWLLYEAQISQVNDDVPMNIHSSHSILWDQSVNEIQLKVGRQNDTYLYCKWWFVYNRIFFDCCNVLIVACLQQAI